MFSTTTQYAMKTITHMAQNPQHLYSVKTLSSELNIPYKYLTKIMTQLAKAKILDSIQGRFGGFAFARDVQSISIKDILKAMEDESVEYCVLNNKPCCENGKCLLHDLWTSSKEKIEDEFLQKKLSQIQQTS